MGSGLAVVIGDAVPLVSCTNAEPMLMPLAGVGFNLLCGLQVQEASRNKSQFSRKTVVCPL